MVQGGGLADLGFLGGSFQWWMGQICDDSTWRDNILPYKFDNPESITGWGYRYKVRIMGIHPQSPDILPSEKLKFASVMYGVTDGGGQGGTFTTPAIRPGNFVFGFFMDAHENVPIIMGILGNNSQTELQGKTELTGGKAFEGISGFAEQEGDKGEAEVEAGPGDRSINRPKTKQDNVESALLDTMKSKTLFDLNVGDNISQITDAQERAEIESMLSYERGLG
jgi:hypothetical protein